MTLVGLSKGRQPAVSGRALLASVVLLLLLCSALLIYGSGRGLDLTDEVFYLLGARDPDAYQLSYQPFGYLLHPLFQLVGRNLQAYRLAGFSIAAGAGVVLGVSLPGPAGNRALFALYGAASALTIFYPWIVTPSYNSAANVGALLIIAAILKALEGTPRAAIASALAGAAGLCIAAFAKPPLFAIAIVGMALTAFAARNARVALAASVVLGAALMSLFLAPADIVALVGRIVVSQHVLSLPNTASALPGKVFRDSLVVPWPLVAAAVAAGSRFLLWRYRRAAWLGYAAIALSLYHLATVAAEAIDGGVPDYLGLGLVTASAGYAGVVRSQRPANGIAIALLLAAPATVALGTFNNQWSQLNFSMAFAFLALFALASADTARWRRLSALALAIIGPAAVLLLAAFNPYGLPASIFDQQVPIEAPLSDGAILVDPQTAAFVRSARGLASGALLVDLSGTGPGVSAVLGARSPVLPWLNPATPTWPEVVWSRMSPAQRDAASFIVPVWPLFERSAPARWLMAHRARFCRTALQPMTFWDETRRLELWRPCATAPRPRP